MATPAGSRIAALRAKFQKGAEGGQVPTPENQLTRMSQAKRNQQKAVRIAKARAARYNMTLRSLAIKTNTKVTKMQRKDLEKKKAVQQEAAKYNMTSRALPVSSVVPYKDRDNLGKALSSNVSPAIAKEVLHVVAQKRHDEDVKQTKDVIRTTVLKRENRAPSKNYLDRAPVEKQVPVQTKLPTDRKNTNVTTNGKPKARIEMGGMQAALASGNEDAINKVILTNFLEASAPHLTDKVDFFVDKYRNRMQDLFDSMLAEYPGAEDAKISGRNKADKEIVEASQPIVENKEPEMEDFPDHDSLPPPAQAEVEAVEEQDEDDFSQDSLVRVEETRAAPKKTLMQEALEELGENEDSIVVNVENAYQDGYESVIMAAEESPEAQQQLSAERRETVMREDQDLNEQLTTTYQAEREKLEQPRKESFQSFISMDSIVEVPTPIEDGYIVAADLEEPEDEQETSRWAVQIGARNPLADKLQNQNLSQEQIDELVTNFNMYTSDMM